MAYTIKWIEENMGITRDMLRNYEERHSIIKSHKDIVSGLITYSDNELIKIWFIKFFVEIGFSVEEVKPFFKGENEKFYQLISNKVEKLEKECEKKNKNLRIAKGIKFTGRVPTVREFGSITFDDFMHYVNTNWDFQDGINMIEKCNEAQIMENNNLLFDANVFLKSVYIEVSTYIKVLARLKNMNPDSKCVQEIVQLIYEGMKNIILLEEYNEENLDITFEEFENSRCFSEEKFREYFANQYTPNSDIGMLNEKKLGKDTCKFIYDAISNFKI